MWSIYFEEVNEIDEIVVKHGFVGYANIYIWRFNEESKSDKEIDVDIYSELVELDTKLGTSSSDQLFECLRFTSRWDIIKVIFSLKLIQGSK